MSNPRIPCCVLLTVAFTIAFPTLGAAQQQSADPARRQRRRARSVPSAARSPQRDEEVGAAAAEAGDGSQLSATDKRKASPRATFDFGGRVQMDYAMFTDKEPFNGTFGTVENSGEFRRLRARANGYVGRVEYKAQLDFAGQKVHPKDLYVGLRGLPVTLRAGYQYEPWGLEQQTSSRYMTFMERSLAIAFSPDRNLGVRVIKNYGDRAHWSAGAFREIAGWETKPGKHYNLTARATYAPVFSEDRRRLLHLGVSYIHKFTDGTVTFKLRPDAHAAPSVVRLTVPASSADYVQLETSSNIGSLQLQAEYVSGWLKSVERNDPRVWAIYGQTSYFLTGENRPYNKSTFGRVKPSRPLFQGGPGAIELKARYAFADFSAASETGVGQIRAFTAGVNWYWTSHLRTMAEFSRSDLPDAGFEATTIWDFRFMVDF